MIVMDMSSDEECTTMPIPAEIVIEEALVMAFTRRTRVINDGVTTTE